MIVTEAQNGQTLEVSPGEVIEIHLPETSSSGYRWHVPSSSGIGLNVARVKDDFEKGSTSAIGGPGTRKLGFEMRNPGSGTIRLVNMRLWEGTPAKEFTLHVHVKPPVTNVTTG
jgi:predicted secreted protein